MIKIYKTVSCHSLVKCNALQNESVLAILCLVMMERSSF